MQQASQQGDDAPLSELDAEQLRFLASALEQMSDAVVAIDDHFHVSYLNPAAERLYGRRLSEARGHHLSELFHVEYYRSGDEQEAWNSMREQGVWRGECRHIVDNRHIPVELAVVALRSGVAGDGMVAVVRDVSARKELEAQLLQAQKLESIGRLAGGIAHDFNNLLTAIGGYADLVYEHVTNEFVREDVAEIRKGVERATALTRQLLAFARRNAHMPQVVALNEVTLQTQKLLQRLLGPTITLHTELASEPTFVLADPIEIEQVLVNMAVNARDAMPNGGRLLLTTSVVGNDERGALVRLQVCDTGMGMSEEVLAHLFEPFFTTKPPGEGTGLGLATCYGIVQQHGGQIAVESRLGEGTTFTIELPACAPEEQCLSPDPICAPLPKGREVRTGHERPRG